MALLLSLGANGCADDAEEIAPVTPTDPSPTTPSETTEALHPLVPEEFAYTWDTDGCTTLDGADGINVYWYAVGSADADGALVMNEQWFWFMGQGDWTQDCVDTFEIEGAFEAFDYAALNCSECEEAYRVTRTLVEASCGVSYGATFGYEEPPEEEVYVSIEMLDTATASGTPNWQNAMLVIHADPYPPGQESYWVVNSDFALGHAFPEGKPGFPSTYDWVGDACYTVE